MSKEKEVSKLVRKARRELGLNGSSQQELLRRVRKALDLTNDELAEALGVKPATLLAYLAPATAAKHRPMPGEVRLVLGRIESQKRAGKRGKK